MTGKGLWDFLTADLKIEGFPLIAITGGGGKTTLMFALVGLLKEKGRVVATTTTKIAAPRAGGNGGLFIGDCRRAAEEIAALPRRGALTIVRERHGAKLRGYTPQEVDTILKKGAADWIVAEADGSRHRPLKAYEEWEPPVPGLTTLQFVLIGADAFTAPLSEETAFRAALLEKRFGARRGEPLRPAVAARILSAAGEYLKNSPGQARRVLLLNKAEILKDTDRAEIMSGLSEAAGYDLLAAVSLKKAAVYGTIKLGGGEVRR